VSVTQVEEVAFGAMRQFSVLARAYADLVDVRDNLAVTVSERGTDIWDCRVAHHVGQRVQCSRRYAREAKRLTDLRHCDAQRRSRILLC
jgi:hypothetical protein